MKKNVIGLFLCLVLVFTATNPVRTVAKAAENGVVYNEHDFYMTWREAMFALGVSASFNFNTQQYKVLDNNPYFAIVTGLNDYYYITAFSSAPTGFYNIWPGTANDYMRAFSYDSESLVSDALMKSAGGCTFKLESTKFVTGFSGSDKFSGGGIIIYTNFPFKVYGSNAVDVVIDLLEPPIPTHSHNWSSVWSFDDDYHWHTCINSDGLCDLSEPADMDSYGVHVYDDDSDVDCNTCGYIRTVVTPEVTPEITPDITPEVSPDPEVSPEITPEVTPEISPDATPTETPTPTPTPTPRPTATPTPTPPPFLPGGLDEDGNWVGYTEFEANTLNFLQDMKGLLMDILWWSKNIVALLFCLVGFECMRIVSAWIKGGSGNVRSG